MCKGILNESISQYAFFGRLLAKALEFALLNIAILF